MKDQPRKGIFGSIWQPAIVLVCLLAVAGIVVACGGSSSSGTTASGMATVSVKLSDPATCSASGGGPFQNVYVTITDVQANISSSASATDSSWTDLTPNLASAPMQIDLLGQANNQCFLASLGDNLQLQAGSYQQIRLILADNSATVANNKCNGSANCVILASDLSVHALQLASEDKTGIKIPSGQIASGAFTIAAGQTKDLDIDFNTCASIVQQGNGQYRLKPVLHAGEVSTTSSSINGTVLDSVTGKPVSGNAFVSLEQPDSNGVYRVIQSTPVATDGTFVFCPLPTGMTYDLVVVGNTSAGVLYQPSIVTGVAVGSTTGNVKLYAPATALLGASSANLTGTVTSAGTSGAVSATVTLSVLESVNSKTYTIPQQPPSTATAPYTPFFESTLGVTTGATATPACTTGTDCFNYSLPVTSGGVYFGAWSASGTTLAPVSMTTSLAGYTVEGQADTCPTGQTTTMTSSPAVQLTGTGPFTSVAITPTLAFTGCS